MYQRHFTSNRHSSDIAWGMNPWPRGQSNLLRVCVCSFTPLHTRCGHIQMAVQNEFPGDGMCPTAPTCGVHQPQHSPHLAESPFWSHSTCVESPDHPVSVPNVLLWNWNGVWHDAVYTIWCNATNCQHTVCMLICPPPSTHSLPASSPDGGSGLVLRQLFLLWHPSCVPALLPRQQAPPFQGLTLCWPPCLLTCWSGTNCESLDWSEAWGTRMGMGMGMEMGIGIQLALRTAKECKC